jgi:hypothetical protein
MDDAMTVVATNDVDQVAVLKEDGPSSYNLEQNVPALSGQMATLQAVVEQMLRDGWAARWERAEGERRCNGSSEKCTHGRGGVGQFRS